MAILNKADCYIYALKESLGINATKNEARLIQRLRSLCTRTDTNGGERMPHTGKEAALLGQGSRITHHRKSIHLQAVIVMES